MRPKVSNKTSTNLELEEIDFRIRQLQNCKKKLDLKDNLLEMSLRLNRSPPIFQTIREKPGIARKPRTRQDLRLGRNLHIHFMIVRRKPEQTLIFRIFSAVNSNFHWLTRNLKKSFNILNGAKSTIYTITTDKNNTSRSLQNTCSKLKHFE